jgi:hypothetical protein
MSETVTAISDLTSCELEAVRSAALWYAKYRGPDVAERAEDRSAAAVVEREAYLALISGLRKLGIRVRPPDALMNQVQQAA